MNLNHAFGFLFVGTIFGLLPRFAPGWCPPTGIDGTSPRELWLQLMSTVMIGIAVVYCGRRILSALAMMLEYDPQRRLARTPAPAMPAAVQVPVARPVTAARRSSQRILPVPTAAFRSGLLEQRRAA